MTSATTIPQTFPSLTAAFDGLYNDEGITTSTILGLILTKQFPTLIHATQTLLTRSTEHSTLDITTSPYIGSHYSQYYTATAFLAIGAGRIQCNDVYYLPFLALITQNYELLQYLHALRETSAIVTERPLNEGFAQRWEDLSLDLTHYKHCVVNNLPYIDQTQELHDLCYLHVLNRILNDSSSNSHQERIFEWLSPQVHDFPNFLFNIGLTNKEYINILFLTIFHIISLCVQYADYVLLSRLLQNDQLSRVKFIINHNAPQYADILRTNEVKQNSIIPFNMSQQLQTYIQNNISTLQEKYNNSQIIAKLASNHQYQDSPFYYTPAESTNPAATVIPTPHLRDPFQDDFDFFLDLFYYQNEAHDPSQITPNTGQYIMPDYVFSMLKACNPLHTLLKASVYNLELSALQHITKKPNNQLLPKIKKISTLDIKNKLTDSDFDHNLALSFPQPPTSTTSSSSTQTIMVTSQHETHLFLLKNAYNYHFYKFLSFFQQFWSNSLCCAVEHSSYPITSAITTISPHSSNTSQQYSGSWFDITTLATATITVNPVYNINQWRLLWGGLNGYPVIYNYITGVLHNHISALKLYCNDEKQKDMVSSDIECLQKYYHSVIFGDKGLNPSEFGANKDEISVYYPLDIIKNYNVSNNTIISPENTIITRKTPKNPYFLTDIITTRSVLEFYKIIEQDLNQLGLNISSWLIYDSNVIYHTFTPGFQKFPENSPNSTELPTINTFSPTEKQLAQEEPENMLFELELPPLNNSPPQLPFPSILPKIIKKRQKLEDLIQYDRLPEIQRVIYGHLVYHYLHYNLLSHLYYLIHYTIINNPTEETASPQKTIPGLIKHIIQSTNFNHNYKSYTSPLLHVVSPSQQPFALISSNISPVTNIFYTLIASPTTSLQTLKYLLAQKVTIKFRENNIISTLRNPSDAEINGVMTNYGELYPERVNVLVALLTNPRWSYSCTSLLEYHSGIYQNVRNAIDSNEYYETFYAAQHVKSGNDGKANKTKSPIKTEITANRLRWYTTNVSLMSYFSGFLSRNPNYTPIITVNELFYIIQTKSHHFFRTGEIIYNDLTALFETVLIPHKKAQKAKSAAALPPHLLTPQYLIDGLQYYYVNPRRLEEYEYTLLMAIEHNEAEITKNGKNLRNQKKSEQLDLLYDNITKIRAKCCDLSLLLNKLSSALDLELFSPSSLTAPSIVITHSQPSLDTGNNFNKINHTRHFWTGLSQKQRDQYHGFINMLITFFFSSYYLFVYDIDPHTQSQSHYDQALLPNSLSEYNYLYTEEELWPIIYSKPIFSSFFTSLLITRNIKGCFVFLRNGYIPVPQDYNTLFLSSYWCYDLRDVNQLNDLHQIFYKHNLPSRMSQQFIENSPEDNQKPLPMTIEFKTGVEPALSTRYLYQLKMMKKKAESDVTLFCTELRHFTYNTLTSKLPGGAYLQNPHFIEEIVEFIVNFYRNNVDISNNKNNLVDYRNTDENGYIGNQNEENGKEESSHNYTRNTGNIMFSNSLPFLSTSPINESIDTLQHTLLHSLQSGPIHMVNKYHHVNQALSKFLQNLLHSEDTKQNIPPVSQIMDLITPITLVLSGIDLQSVKILLSSQKSYNLPFLQQNQYIITDLSRISYQEDEDISQKRLKDITQATEKPSSPVDYDITSDINQYIVNSTFINDIEHYFFTTPQNITYTNNHTLTSLFILLYTFSGGPSTFAAHYLSPTFQSLPLSTGSVTAYALWNYLFPQNDPSLSLPFIPLLTHHLVAHNDHWLSQLSAKLLFKDALTRAFTFSPLPSGQSMKIYQLWKQQSQEILSSLIMMAIDIIATPTNSYFRQQHCSLLNMNFHFHQVKPQFDPFLDNSSQISTLSTTNRPFFTIFRGSIVNSTSSLANWGYFNRKNPGSGIISTNPQPFSNYQTPTSLSVIDSLRFIIYVIKYLPQNSTCPHKMDNRNEYDGVNIPFSTMLDIILRTIHSNPAVTPDLLHLLLHLGYPLPDELCSHSVQIDSNQHYWWVKYAPTNLYTMLPSLFDPKSHVYISELITKYTSHRTGNKNVLPPYCMVMNKYTQNTYLHNILQFNQHNSYHITTRFMMLCNYLKHASISVNHKKSRLGNAYGENIIMTLCGSHQPFLLSLLIKFLNNNNTSEDHNMIKLAANSMLLQQDGVNRTILHYLISKPKMNTHYESSLYHYHFLFLQQMMGRLTQDNEPTEHDLQINFHQIFAQLQPYLQRLDHELHQEIALLTSLPKPSKIDHHESNDDESNQNDVKRVVTFNFDDDGPEIPQMTIAQRKEHISKIHRKISFYRAVLVYLQNIMYNTSQKEYSASTTIPAPDATAAFHLQPSLFPSSFLSHFTAHNSSKSLVAHLYPHQKRDIAGNIDVLSPTNVAYQHNAQFAPFLDDFGMRRRYTISLNENLLSLRRIADDIEQLQSHHGQSISTQIMNTTETTEHPPIHASSNDPTEKVEIHRQLFQYFYNNNPYSVTSNNFINMIQNDDLMYIYNDLCDVYNRRFVLGLPTEIDDLNDTVVRSQKYDEQNTNTVLSLNHENSLLSPNATSLFTLPSLFTTNNNPHEQIRLKYDPFITDSESLHELLSHIRSAFYAHSGIGNIISDQLHQDHQWVTAYTPRNQYTNAKRRKRAGFISMREKHEKQQQQYVDEVNNELFARQFDHPNHPDIFGLEFIYAYQFLPHLNQLVQDLKWDIDPEIDDAVQSLENAPKKSDEDPNVPT